MLQCMYRRTKYFTDFFSFFLFFGKKDSQKTKLDIRDESFFHVLDAATANRQEH